MLMDEIAMAVASGEHGIEAGVEARDSNGPRMAVHEERTFDLPGSIWMVMLLSYAVFFGGLALAVGGSLDALGAVVISVCFAIMYFGVATIMVRIARSHRTEGSPRTDPASRSIETLTGTLPFGAAAAQILTVPILFGFFALAIAIIRSIIIPG